MNLITFISFFNTASAEMPTAKFKSKDDFKKAAPKINMVQENNDFRVAVTKEHMTNTSGAGGSSSSVYLSPTKRSFIKHIAWNERGDKPLDFYLSGVHYQKKELYKPAADGALMTLTRFLNLWDDALGETRTDYEAEGVIPGWTMYWIEWGEGEKYIDRFTNGNPNPYRYDKEIDMGERGLTGIRVCSSKKKKNNRLKGIEAEYALINHLDGTKAGVYTPRDFKTQKVERANCGEWHDWVKCPRDMFASGLYIERDNEGSAVGLRLQCARTEYVKKENKKTIKKIK